MTKKEVLPLVAILSISALLSSSMLTYGHVWWDDFAAYIMQAESILSGDMPGFVAHNTITIKNFYICPKLSHFDTTTNFFTIYK